MNDGHCPKCGELMAYLGGTTIQQWQCRCGKIVYRVIGKLEIYQTYEEASSAG